VWYFVGSMILFEPTIVLSSFYYHFAEITPILIFQ
jgi:hypothetical protein